MAMLCEVLWTVYSSRIQPQLGERSLPILLMTAILPEVPWAEAAASRIMIMERADVVRGLRAIRKKTMG